MHTSTPVLEMKLHWVVNPLQAFLTSQRKDLFSSWRHVPCHCANETFAVKQLHLLTIANSQHVAGRRASPTCTLLLPPHCRHHSV